MTDRVRRVGVNALFLPPDTTSGTGRYTWELVQRLAAIDGLELVVFAQGGWVPESVADLGLEIRSCPRFSQIPLRIVYEQFVLPIRASRAGVDVLWSPAYVCPRFGRVPSVLTVHDLYFARFPEAIPGIRRRYYRAMVPRSARRAAIVLTGARNTADDLVELVDGIDPDTIRVTPYGVDPDLADISPAAIEVPDDYVLMVAASTANKNVAAVIEAVGRLRELGRSVELVVVGADPYGLLAQARQDLGAGDWLHEAGVVSAEALAAYYRGATVYVAASHYEGFGLPVLEAQVMGVPVVSSRGGALPEVAGDGAVLFDSSSVHELVSALDEVLASAELRADLVRRGADNAARFTWEACARDTAAAFESAAT